MPSRRQFIQTGLSAFAIGMLRRTGMAMPPWPQLVMAVPPSSIDDSRPFFTVPMHPDSVLIQGMPFAPGFFGDPFPQEQIPFHQQENAFPDDVPPLPSETVDIAIVGGGLSGLMTAYFLREHRPVIFELHPQFGGVSKGEIWGGTPYSMGGAYFMTPDEGSFLESLYHELGLDEVYRLSPGGNDPMELNGAVYDDFWNGTGLPPDQVPAFKKYAQIVEYFANESYPDIPFVEGRNNDWIIALDQKTLKQDIEERMGDTPVPPLLAAGIQSYCYSSFNAGWDSISAASGWNFIAAEEFGRWVCPGGNAYVTNLLWEKLVHAYSHGPGGNQVNRLRPNTRAVDVRMAGNGMALVSYKTPEGQFKSLLAKRVVMANSKHICKYMLPDLPVLDPQKQAALTAVYTNPYLVANVLLTEPIDLDFYDLFLLGDGNYPMTDFQVAADSFVTDMLRGDFAHPQPTSRSVLTLYWPLPWGEAVFTIIGAGAWSEHAEALVPQIDFMLNLLKLPRSAIRQVRIARWGHAMPIAYPGFIANGNPQEYRRPFQDVIYFANQDNWALPAFETAVLEAQYVADKIEASW